MEKQISNSSTANQESPAPYPNAALLENISFAAECSFQEQKRATKKILPNLSYPQPNINHHRPNHVHNSKHSQSQLAVKNIASNLNSPLLLKNITCQIKRGSITHIVGPSGSGKSTFIRLFNRLNEPSVGKLEILGKNIYSWNVCKLRQQVAIVFQQPSLVGLDVKNNLLLPFKLQTAQLENFQERAIEILQLAGLTRDFLTRNENQLSGGQKYRVALARALITNPQILLLDEPTSSLDPPAAKALLARVADICHKQGITLLIVTHRLSEVRQLGGNLAVLIDGELRGFGDVEKILEESGDKQVNSFLQGEIHGPN